jgi:hypothetical protein
VEVVLGKNKFCDIRNNTYCILRVQFIFPQGKKALASSPFILDLVALHIIFSPFIYR